MSVDRRGLGLLALVLVLTAPWCNVPLDNADGAGMLAHLQGLFRDLDLLYDDDFRALHVLPVFTFVTDAGVASNHWPIGATFLQAPAYLLGRAIAAVIGHEGWVVPLLCVRTAAMLVLAAMAIVLHRALGGGNTAKLAVAAMVLGTPLLYYATEAPLRPHLWGAAVVLALVLRWEDRDRPPTAATFAVLGALAGLATAIRPQLLPLVALPLQAAAAEPGGRARTRAIAIVLAAFCPWPLVVASLQSWIYGADVLDYVAGGTTHHLGLFLASPFHGVLAWTPVVAIGLAGLVLGAIRGRRGALVVMLIVAHQIWLDSGSKPVTAGHVLGTATWAGGTAFGPRKLVEIVPLFVPAVRWLDQSVRSPAARRGLALATLVCTGWTGVLYLGAVLDPSLTERVVDGGELVRGAVRVASAEAWGTALGERRVPLSWVAACTLPWAAVLGIGAWTRRGRPSDRAVAGAVLGTSLVAHLWLALLIARSDGLLVADPERMARVQREMWPRHLAMLERARAYRAGLRARFGPDAEPE